MTTHSREQVAMAFKGLLPDTYAIIDDPVHDVGEADPSLSCYLQLVRQRIERAPVNPFGAFLETFEIWVASTDLDIDTLENSLDDRLDEVTEIIEQISWLTWSAAERRVHKSGLPAFLITAQTITDREQETS